MIFYNLEENKNLLSFNLMGLNLIIKYGPLKLLMGHINEQIIGLQKPITISSRPITTSLRNETEVGCRRRVRDDGMQTGNCFRCRRTGHWISDCPLKSNADDDPPPPSIHCPCGGGLCETKLSNTHENPGRRFYKCPAVRTSFTIPSNQTRIEFSHLTI